MNIEKLKDYYNSYFCAMADSDEILKEYHVLKEQILTNEMMYYLAIEHELKTKKDFDEHIFYLYLTTPHSEFLKFIESNKL